MSKYILALVLVFMLCITGCSIKNELTWFNEEGYEIVEALQGYRFMYINKAITSEANTDLIKDSLQFINWELLTWSGKLLRYRLEDINSYGSQSNRDIIYVDFTEKCSSNLFYSNISNGYASVLYDYKSNITHL